MGASDAAATESFGDVFRGGSGPPLLLLHSGLCTWMEWRTTIPYLSGDHEVIAPTRPGSFGGTALHRGRSFLATQADYVEKLLDDAGWSDPVAVAGSSHGGVIGLELAARGRASTVVSLAPPWLDKATLPAYLAFFSLGGLALRATLPLYPPADRLSPRLGGLVLHGSATAMAMSAEDMLATLRSVGGFPLARMVRFRNVGRGELPDFERIDVPVTIAWGTRDRLAPLWMSRRWLAAMPDAEFVTLPGFPHVPHLRDPERIADLISERAAVPAETSG